MRILVIDDDGELLEAIRRTLLLEGFEVITASSAIEGVRLARQMQPDLMLCDVIMPDHTGHWVIGQLRESVETADIPFIMLTGETRPADIRAGMVLGADDYLCKPVIVSDLINSIHARQAKRQAQVKRERGRTEKWAEEFGRVLSHELRTPLGLIGPGLELLNNAVDNKNLHDIRTVSQFVNQGASRLGEAVERIELYMSLVAPSGAVQPETISCSETAADVVATIEAERVARKWQRTSDLRLEIEKATVSVDSTQFSQVIRELLDNAFKFSKPTTLVTLRLSVEGDRACVRVSDAGYGMSPAQISALSAFRQFDRDRREQQGLGIGIAIVSLLVERMHGVFSLRPGPTGGLIAEIRVPTAPDRGVTS